MSDVIAEMQKGFEHLKSTNEELIEKKLSGLGVAELEAKMAKIEKDLDSAETKSQEEQAAKLVAEKKAEEMASQLDELRVAFNRGGESKAEQEDLHAKAVEMFLSKGEKALDEEAYKALATDTDGNGGYGLAITQASKITDFMFETSPMRAYASVGKISTGEWKALIDSDEAGAGWVGERAGRPATSTPTLGEKVITTHEMYADPRATQTMIDDASFDVANWLAGKVSRKFSRLENTSFVNGDGVVQPRGILTYADGVIGPAGEREKIEQIESGAVGGIDADAMFDLQGALKADYNGNARFFFNRATLTEVRKLKDGQGNYLWAPGFNGGTGPALLGKEYALFEDMPALATDSLSVAYGDMREAYQIVDRTGIRVLRDPYTARPYVSFYTTKRTGGDVVNYEALKLMVTG
jgi:HK97 family phage major capsid protein